MGKLIVIDGLDGAGKKTQLGCLDKRLIEEGYETTILDFPQYDKDSSIFVRNYLGGIYGPDPKVLTAYQASLCYAMDRFDCFKRNPELLDVFTRDKAFLLSNRYVTSNMIYQSTKMDRIVEIPSFLDWEEKTEYDLLGIPRPDLVMFLYMPIEYSLELMRSRNITDTAQKNNMQTDIHENDENFLRTVAEKALLVAELKKFHLINCIRNNELRTVEDIHEEVYSLVKKIK